MELQLKKIVPLFLLIFFAPALAFMLSPVEAHASVSVIGLPSNNLGLVGHWTFNEGSGTVANDSSGKGNNGTLSGSPLPSWVTGELGGALSFNTSNYVDIGTPSSLEGLQVPLTITAWFYTSTNSGLQTIYGAYKSTGSGQIWSMVRLDSGTLRFYASNSGGSYQSFGSYTPTTNQWHFVAVTVSGSISSPTVTITLDGQSQSGSLSALDATPDTSVDIQIGHNTGPGEGFNGTIDDVRVYDRALTAAEIAALYQNTGDPATINTSMSPGTLGKGLVGYWPLDGSTITSNIQDISGQGNNGDMIGFTSTTSAETIGKIGGALNFNGSDYVPVTPPTGDTQTATVCAWIKTTSASNSYIYSQNASANNANMGLVLNSTTNKISFFIFNGSSIGIVTSATSVNTGKWVYGCGMRNGIDMSIYVNGVSDGSITNGLTTTVSTNWATIGSNGENGSYSGNFNGTIDDVRVYNRALSASEVMQLYNLGQGTHVNASSAAVTDGSSLQSGLVGLWTFDGKDMQQNVTDESGQGNNGHLVGFTSTTTSETIGKLGQALKFNGTNQYISVPYAPSLAPTAAISFGAWFYNTNVSQNSRVLSKTEAGGYSLAFNDDSLTGLTATVHTSGGYFYVNDASISNDTWYYAFVTYNGTTLRLYVDGVDVSDTAASGGAITYTDNNTLCIGYEPGTSTCNGSGGASSYFPGTIDDVRIYNRALSASEVQQLYNLGK